MSYIPLHPYIYELSFEQRPHVRGEGPLEQAGPPNWWVDLRDSVTEEFIEGHGFYDLNDALDWMKKVAVQKARGG